MGTSYPTAPWLTEPLGYATTHAGLPCELHRESLLHHWCGYVGLDPGHPLYGVEGNAASPALKDGLQRLLEQPLAEIKWRFAVGLAALSGCANPTPALVLSVHGGITWAANHLPWIAIPAGNWWYGFDCNHCDDLCPDMEQRMEKYGLPRGNGQWRTLDYALTECRFLAEQLAALAAVA